MKVVRGMMRFVTVILAVAAVACCVIAYWDKVVDAANWVKEKLDNCHLGSGCSASEFEDYADWDE